MKNLKRKLIQAAEELAVADLFAPEDRLYSAEEGIPDRDEAGETARDWASDPEAHREIGKRLAKHGDDAMNILLQAFNRAGQIDGIVIIDVRVLLADCSELQCRQRTRD